MKCDIAGRYRSTAGWFIVGGAVGACAALLLAPTSGAKARARLAQGFRDSKTSLVDLTGELVEKVDDVREEAAQTVENAVSAGHEVIVSIKKNTSRAAAKRR